MVYILYYGVKYPNTSWTCCSFISLFFCLRMFCLDSLSSLMARARFIWLSSRHRFFSSFCFFSYWAVSSWCYRHRQTHRHDMLMHNYTLSTSQFTSMFCLETVHSGGGSDLKWERSSFKHLLTLFTANRNHPSLCWSPNTTLSNTSLWRDRHSVESADLS